MAVENAVVANTNDDAMVEGATFYNLGWTSGGTNYAGDLGTSNHWGARFVTSVPQGSTISSAILSLWGLESGSLGAIDLRIYVEDADNPGAWASGSHEPHNFTPTSSFVSWAPGTWPTGQYNTAPDIAAEIQKVVDRAGFDGAICVGVRNNGAGGGWIGGADYSENAAHAPKLDITYTASGTPTAAVTGTITAAADEDDIVAGGKTVVVTLTGAQYVPASVQPVIEYVGGQVNSFAGKTATTTVTFALTGGLAAVPAAGDLVIVTYVVGSTVDRALTIRNASAVDYDLAGSELYQNDNFDANQRTAYRFMPGTPETTFVLSGTGSTADAGAYTVHVFRNVDPTTPLDVAAVTAGGTGSRVINPGTITPSTAGAVLYVAGGAAALTGGTFNASYLSDFRATTRADTNDAMVGAGYVAWTSGPYDPAAFGGGGTTTANDSWTAITLALRPAPPTTPFADARSDFRDGIVSAQSEATGLNARRATIFPLGNFERTSDNQATITAAADSGFDITAAETVTVTVPASILVSGGPIVATPTFGIAHVVGGGDVLLAAVSFSGTGTASFTAGRIQNAAVSFAGAGTASFAATRVLSAAVAFAGAGTTSASATVIRGASVSFAGAGTTSFTARRVLAASVAYAGAGSATFTARKITVAQVSFAGAGTFSTSPTVYRSASVSYAGAGTASFSASRIQSAAVSFAGAGAFSATGNILGGPVTHTAAVAFAGAGSFQASATAIRAASVSWAGAGAFSALPTVYRAASVGFSGAGTFASSASVARGAAVQFAGAGTFAASASIVVGAVVHEAQVSFAGAGTFSASAFQTHMAQVSFLGVGTFNAAVLAPSALTLTLEITQPLRLDLAITQPLRLSLDIEQDMELDLNILAGV